MRNLVLCAGHLVLLGKKAGRQEMRRNYGGEILLGKSTWNVEKKMGV
jgi:hypothetical protein